MSEARRFHRLHVPGDPLFLPNAWDLPSARMLVGSGFATIGTTSLGVASVADKPDGIGATRQETVDLVRSLGRLAADITVDIEGGFSDDPSSVADLVAELVSFGAVGINIEDGRADGALEPQDLQVHKIRAIRAATPEVFINARTDPFWLGHDDPISTAVARAAAYCEAGADGIFVPGVSERALIAALVEAIPAPVNVLFQPDGPSVADLADLGVARVSSGSLLFRASLGTVGALADEIRRGNVVAAAGIPSYAELQSR